MFCRKNSFQARLQLSKQKKHSWRQTGVETKFDSKVTVFQEKLDCSINLSEWTPSHNKILLTPNGKLQKANFYVFCIRNLHQKTISRLFSRIKVNPTIQPHNVVITIDEPRGIEFKTSRKKIQFCNSFRFVKWFPERWQQMKYVLI